MEKFDLNADVETFYIEASTFPEGVLAAHQKLHSLVPYANERRYFGLSWMENGKIVYKAAAEELVPGELSKHDLETLTIPAGEYESILVNNFMNDIQGIAAAFDQLIQLPNIDPMGYCIEWYISDTDVRCMVRVI